MKKRFLLTIFNLFLIVSFIRASYMDTGYIEWQQPNGITFTARIWGDEFENWMETDDGYRICKGMDGFYYYAVLDEYGEFTVSDKKVAIDTPLTESCLFDRTEERKAENHIDCLN